jgi:sugar-specific transcriptional regulator TrmB
MHAVDALTDLGFTEIEARVYCFLLQEGSASGYRVAQGIGKATANTYKAIEDLAARGVVLIDSGDTRLVRPVEPSEVLATLARDAAAKRKAAEAALTRLEAAPPDERVYRLTKPAQVFERARSMLTSAEAIVLADIFPSALDHLADALESTARRGVRVVARTYSARPIARVETLVVPGAEEAFGAWPGMQMSVVADAREHIFCLFTESLDRVLQSVWSNSLFLSCLAHNHIASEITMTASDTGRRLRPISLLRARPPGLIDLATNYRRPALP